MAPPELTCFQEDREVGKPSLIGAGVRMVELQSRPNDNNNGMRVASDWINFVDTPIFGIDKHSVIHTWNSKAAELISLSFDEVWNSSLENLVTPATVEPLRSSLQDALDG